MADDRPSAATVKTLFALSGNTCAYRGCEEKLTDPSWPKVKAEICHIRGRRPGSARFDPSMSDADRNAFENLVLLCPNHHTLVDDLAPRDHPPELLGRMKAAHEEAGQRKQTWATEVELDRVAALALAAMERPETREDGPAPQPRLALRMRNETIDIANLGQGVAVRPQFRGADQTASEAIVIASNPPPQLDPGEVWRRAAEYMGQLDPGPFSVILRCEDRDGEVIEAVTGVRLGLATPDGWPADVEPEPPAQ